MKKLVTLAITCAALTWTSSAHAKHAYRSMSCSSTSLQLRYKGNYPVGGYDGLAKIGTDVFAEGAIELMTLDKSYGEVFNKAEYAEADVIYDVVSAKVLSSKSSNDDDFDSKEAEILKVIKIEKASEKAQKEFQLKKGQKITFICNETFDTPR